MNSHTPLNIQETLLPEIKKEMKKHLKSVFISPSTLLKEYCFKNYNQNIDLLLVIHTEVK